MLYHLQEPDFKVEDGKTPYRFNDNTPGYPSAKGFAEGKVNDRVISMAIAIGVSSIYYNLNLLYRSTLYAFSSALGAWESEQRKRDQRKKRNTLKRLFEHIE